MTINITPKLVKRFNNKFVRADSGCWNWIAARDLDGYGVIWIHEKRRGVGAHRLSALLAGMDIEGKLVCHTCDNPGCVNPQHLFTGLPQDNMTDKVLKGRQSRVGNKGNVKGETNGCAKLTDDAVRYIRANYRVGISGQAGTGNIRELADQFNVSKTTIVRAATGQKWKHI